LNTKKLLSDFATGVSVATFYTDGVKWPFKSGGCIKPVLKEYGEFFVNLFDKIDDIAPLFNNSQQLMRCSHHYVNGMKAMGLSREEIAPRLVKLAKAIIKMQGGNGFIEYGDFRVRENVNVSDSSRSQAMLRLATALWAYSETLYFVHRQTACEYHGTYDLPDGNFAVCRDFCNLEPSDLWEDFDFGEVPDKISIYTAHSRDLKIEFDNYNNLYVRAGSMSKSLQYGEVIADGKIISDSKIADLLMLISKKLTEFHTIIDQMGDVAVKHKYIDIFWYRCKPMADFLGVDWKPSTHIHEKADIAFKNPEPFAHPKGEQTYEEYRKQYDYSDCESHDSRLFPFWK